MEGGGDVAWAITGTCGVWGLGTGAGVGRGTRDGERERSEECGAARVVGVGITAQYQTPMCIGIKYTMITNSTL